MIFKTSDSTYMKSSLSLLSLKLPERDFLTQYFYQGKKKISVNNECLRTFKYLKEYFSVIHCQK